MDKNYKSYENLSHEIIAVGELNPHMEGWTSWDDTMKTYRCLRSDFMSGYLVGGKEDCLDVGTHTKACYFENFDVDGKHSRYLITLKSHSTDNMFHNWHVLRHAKCCDIQQGNWSDSDNGSNEDNEYWGWTTEDGKPVTYSYRFFSNSKPVFVNMKAKHLWWLSLAITAYFWGKWVVTKVRG